MRKPRKYNLEFLAVAVFILAAAFILLLKSPLNFWLRADVESDSGVYQTVALMMSRGYMPYKDSFDHKGPLIYLINLLGMQFDAYCGVWLIEFVFMSITFAAIYKIARLKCGKILSCLCVLTCGALLYDYFEGGNMVEEYALPFIAVSLYIFLDYFLNRKISRPRLLVCGLCFGAVLLLRPNMAALWAVFCIAVFIDCVKKKKMDSLGEFVLFFVLGMALIMAPVFLWLVLNGCFDEFVKSYISFNFVYSAYSGEGAKWNALFYFINKPLIILCIIITAYFCAFKDRFLYVTYLLYMALMLLLTAMSGMPYAHYGMIFVPAAVFPLASFLGFFHTENGGKTVTLFIALYISVTFAFPKWLTTAGDLVNKYADRSAEHHSEMVKGVCELIEENTEENERISVYGNGGVVYLVSGRLHATKYSYQFPIGEILEEIMDEYFAQLESELPSVIVIWQREADERITAFLSANNYVDISDEQSYDIGKTKVFLRAEY